MARHKIKLLVTCEHGGAGVPAAYAGVFAGRRKFLSTHRGFDRGALLMARGLARGLSAPLVASTVTRLLVDLNRSEDNSGLHWSKVSRLPAAVRSKIVGRYWRPHRLKVETLVRAGLRRGVVVHVGSHSFTPVMRGARRRADIGILFDPSRAREARLAKLWIAALREQLPGLVVMANSPYAGTGDGLTTSLRGLSPRYLGLELEVNQKFLRDGQFPPPLRGRIVASLRAALAGF